MPPHIDLHPVDGPVCFDDPAMTDPVDLQFLPEHNETMAAWAPEQRINILRRVEPTETVARTTVPFRRPGAAAHVDLPQCVGCHVPPASAINSVAARRARP